MREKEFKLRNAPLTEKLEQNEDFKNFYNLCVTILTTFLIDTIIRNYAQTNSYQFGFRLIMTGFNKFHIVILIWCLLNTLAVVSFLSFSLWANVRILLPPKTSKFWDQTWLLLLIFYYIFSLYGIQKVVNLFGFKPCSAVLLLLEHVRLLMKQHAFIRTTASKVLGDKTQNFSPPKIQKFAYFLFAPTLIYRDEYPRTPHIRWKILFYNLFGFFYVLWFWSLLAETFWTSDYENFCTQKITLSKFISLVIGNGLLGILAVLCMFHLVFHSSQIIFAELLCFGDRMFYKEWWTAKSGLDFMRKWNVLVQDWLYFYVFKDVYLVSKNKSLSIASVLVISAIFHEWIVMNSLNLFLPLLSGGILLAIASKMLSDPIDFQNDFIFVLHLAFVIAVNINLYTLEYFARQNCLLGESDSKYDFFKSRIITCNCVENF